MPIHGTPKRLSGRKDKTPTKTPPIDVGKANGPYDSYSVRERVRQWQASGGGVVFTTDAVFESSDDANLRDGTQEIRRRTPKRESPATKHTPPKQRKRPEEPRTTSSHQQRHRRDKSEEPAGPPKTRSASAPRRRIVSDGHWRADRGLPERPSQLNSRKTPNPSWNLPDDGIRVRPIPNEQLRSSPSKVAEKEMPSYHKGFDDGIRVYGTTHHDDTPNGRSSRNQATSSIGDDTSSEDHLTFHSPTPSERHDHAMKYDGNTDDEHGMRSPYPNLDRSPKYRTNNYPNIKRSLGVRFTEPDKAIKKGGKRLNRSGIFSNVLEESKKIFAKTDHIPVEEPRMPSIESWLNETSDPFTDGPSFDPNKQTLMSDFDPAEPSRDKSIVETEPFLDKFRSDDWQPSKLPTEACQTPESPTDMSKRHRNHQRRRSNRSPSTSIDPGLDNRDCAPRDHRDSIACSDKPGREPDDSCSSSLRRCGAHKRSAQKKTPVRSSLSALKAAFSVQPPGISQEISSPNRSRMYETSESIHPLRTATTQTATTSHISDRKLPTTAPVSTIPVRCEDRVKAVLVSDACTPVEDNGPTTEVIPSKDAAGLERKRSKITKHADLISMLSQPNCKVGRSIRSARSVRIGQSKAEVVSLSTILAELAADEEKYMRELLTLVDGVIPVLLSSILSRSDAAVTVGLFSKKTKKDPDATKPIYDMGIALERLKRAHKRINVNQPESIIAWARSTQYIYWDYLQAWRMGFQDVVVNLAPAESKSNQTDTRSAVSGGLQKNESGDVVNCEGERVDVAFLLKRPLIRIRDLARTFRDLHAAQPTTETEEMDKKYKSLVEEARNRVNEERARLEDEAAAAIDSTRARDIQSLGALEGVVIDDTRRVRARDCFDLTLHHTSCQVIDCRIELIVRQDKDGKDSSGDILICELDGTGKWLLFPPVRIDNVSARNGEREREIVVMIQGKTSNGQAWHELLSLFGDDEETGFEWVQMLGLVPVPPAIQRSRSFIAQHKNFQNGSSAIALIPGQSDPTNQTRSNFQEVMDVPLGEQTKRGHTIVADAPDLNLPATSRARLQKQNPTEVSKSKTNLPQADTTVELCSNSTSNVPADTTANKIPVPQKKSYEALVDNGLHKHIQVPHHPRLLPASPAKPTSPSGSRPLLNPVANARSKNEQNPIQSIPESAGNRTKPWPTSPLKQEYAPSTDSETSTTVSDESSLQQDMSSASDSDDSDLEDGDIAMPLLPPGALNRLKSGANVICTSHGSRGTIAPSESASQAPYKQVPEQPDQAIKTIASIFYWSSKGAWEPMHPDECSIVVTPGLIEAYEMSASHSKLSDSLLLPNPSHMSKNRSPVTIQPLIGLELTPLVPIRRGTALDISVRSPPTADSKIKNVENANILFRSRNSEECEGLYALINVARINNPTYIALQNARATSFAKPFGGASFDGSKNGSRSSWFGFGGGNRSSYRASSAPTPSAGRQSESSTGSAMSAFSALRKLGVRSSRFNIARSTITSRQGGSRASGSVFSSSEQSSSSGTSTPIPAAISGAIGVIDSTSIEGAAPIGLSNAKIRLYIRESASKWRDLGAARLTIMRPTDVPDVDPAIVAGGDTDPPTTTSSNNEPVLRAPGSGQPSASDKRVLVSSKKTGETLLDVTLGESCFERVARTGIAVSVWETTLSEEGHVARQGGVSGGRVKVYMLQMNSEAETAYTFGIVGKFRY